MRVSSAESFPRGLLHVLSGDSDVSPHNIVRITGQDMKEAAGKDSADETLMSPNPVYQNANGAKPW